MGKDDITNKEIYALLTDIKKTTDDTRIELQNLRQEFQTKSEALENNIKCLESENVLLKSRLLATERRLRENSILIFGLKLDSTSLIESVVKFISEKLKVKIILDLVSNLKKFEIFSNLFLLKDTGVSFVEDLPFEDRQDRKILVAHLKAAKSKNLVAKIRKNTLVIDGEVFSLTELNVNNDLQIKQQLPSNSIPKAVPPKPSSSSQTHASDIHSSKHSMILRRMQN
ncbi:hypothetical protein JTB14_016267 [Gonioctena quinquepunctata]|nr:hypothetical protein JTB14_016267 [Gonioctena quinquepunctata]